MFFKQDLYHFINTLLALTFINCSLGVKRSGRKADHSPSHSAEIKNARRYTSTAPYIFMVWCSIKQGTPPRPNTASWRGT
jgi:hypothetical protein